MHILTRDLSCLSSSFSWLCCASSVPIVIDLFLKLVIKCKHRRHEHFEKWESSYTLWNLRLHICDDIHTHTPDSGPYYIGLVFFCTRSFESFLCHLSYRSQFENCFAGVPSGYNRWGRRDPPNPSPPNSRRVSRQTHYWWWIWSWPHSGVNYFHNYF